MIPTIESFMAEWAEPFNLVHEGLNYLAKFPRKQLGGYHPGPVLTLEERLKLQDDWLLQHTAMDGPDKDFFKPFWVPMQTNTFDPLYLNLALPGLPVFCVQYVQTCPPIWGGYVAVAVLERIPAGG
jgi:hypothetical protein